MEGGSPALIWKRWNLPMYYAQQRYWSDNPRMRDLFIAANFKRYKRKKTPPPKRGRAADPGHRIDPGLFDAPLSRAELTGR